MAFIKLKSVDCMQFKINTEVAKFMGTIKTMLEDCDVDDQNDAVVPLPKVRKFCVTLWNEPIITKAMH